LKWQAEKKAGSLLSFFFSFCFGLGFWPLFLRVFMPLSLELSPCLYCIGCGAVKGIAPSLVDARATVVAGKRPSVLPIIFLAECAACELACKRLRFFSHLFFPRVQKLAEELFYRLKEERADNVLEVKVNGMIGLS